MATHPDTKIFEALTARLATLVTGLPVAWPNVDFKPGQGGYLKPSWLPADTVMSAVAQGTHQARGVFQVSVYWPEDDGLTAPLEVAGAVAAHFAKGTKLDRQGVRVRVENPPSVAAALQETGWLQVPVTVPYRAFV